MGKSGFIVHLSPKLQRSIFSGSLPQTFKLEINILFEMRINGVFMFRPQIHELKCLTDIFFMIDFRSRF